MYFAYQKNTIGDLLHITLDGVVAVISVLAEGQ